MIDGSVLQSAQKCFEKKSRVVVKMVVKSLKIFERFTQHFQTLKRRTKIVIRLMACPGRFGRATI